MKTKVLSIYYSGTGNTKVFQEFIKESCANYEVEFTELDITYKEVNTSEELISKYDVILLGAPTYFYAYPHRVIEFIKKHFKEGRNQKIIIYTTSTSAKNETSQYISSILKSKGYIVSDVVNIKSLNNFYFSSTIKPPMYNTKQEVFIDYNKCARIIKEYIFTNKTNKHGRVYNPFSVTWHMAKYYFLRVFFISSFAFRNFGVNYTKCKHCGICETNCPNHNIEMHNGTPTFDKNCYACMKCIQKCPNNAITYKDYEIRQMDSLTIEDFKE